MDLDCSTASTSYISKAQVSPPLDGLSALGLSDDRPGPAPRALPSRQAEAAGSVTVSRASLVSRKTGQTAPGTDVSAVTCLMQWSDPPKHPLTILAQQSFANGMGAAVFLLLPPYGSSSHRLHIGEADHRVGNSSPVLLPVLTP